MSPFVMRKTFPGIALNNLIRGGTASLPQNVEEFSYYFIDRSMALPIIMILYGHSSRYIR